MGSLLGLTMRGPADARDRASARAFTVVGDLERMLTRFDAASDLCRVNRAAGRRVRVPVELARALRLARRLARITDGAFDPTAGPLVDLWRGAPRGARPSQWQVADATRRVGWRGLAITDRHVRLARAGMT